MQRPTDILAEPTGSPQHFERLIARQEHLCHELEALADHLPDRIDTLAAQTLADVLQPTLRSCQQLEEAYVFPVVLHQNAIFSPTVARLRAEHLEDEDHAAMVAEAVTRFVRAPRHGDADRLGYLIRGLFQPLLRHTAFDRDVMLPLYRRAATNNP